MDENEIPKHFSHVELNEHIEMPNHVHRIITIPKYVGANNHSPLMDENEIPEHFPHVELNEHIEMPNHVHRMITIPKYVGANNHSPLTDKRILCPEPANQ